MKVSQLLEAEQELKSETLIGSMLLKLYKAKQPMKVLMTGLNRVVKQPDGKKINVSIPAQEWNIKKVQIIQLASEKTEVRVHTDSPDDWFEIIPEDDRLLTIKKMDDHWLLTSRDGKGVKL